MFVHGLYLLLGKKPTQVHKEALCLTTSVASTAASYLLLVGLFFLLPAPAWSNDASTDGFAKPYAQRDEVHAYVQTLERQHGFKSQALLELFSQAELRTDIIDRISKPAEKVWTWGKYKALLVGKKRIDAGVGFWRTHEETLNRAHQVYGVAPEYVVAILGIETRYGEVLGNFRVLDALLTLGFDYPPRAKFFRKELTQFLLLAREENKTPLSLKGSYAGAMGYGQFISSSYRHYAVDFDNDGVRDIWQNPVDAIGSIANYFAEHKWRGQHPVAEQVLLSSQTAAVLQDLQSDGALKLRKTVGELQSRGLVLSPEQQARLPSDLKAALFKLQTESGNEYWLGLHDLYVITRYNHSHLYAFAVHHLAEQIRMGFEEQP